MNRCFARSNMVQWLTLASVCLAASRFMQAAMIDPTAAPPATPITGTFAFTHESKRLSITHAGRPVGDYVFQDDRILRPYFSNLRAPDGSQVTRHFPPPPGQASDHETMHPGIWLGFGDVSGNDFWRNKAMIRHERFSEPPATRNGKSTFATESTMLASQGGPLAKLVCHYTLTQEAAGMLLVWEAAITPTADDFYFGDQEEMGFGVRVNAAVTEKAGGRITNANGLETAKSTWGKPAAWCDYSGVVDGRRIGVAVFPDPKNFRPSWWHNRDYGAFVANPFGRKAMKQGESSRVEVRRGETFRLRFAALLHSTPADVPPDLAKAFSEFTRTGSELK
jgi:hypothetical protein